MSAETFDHTGKAVKHGRNRVNGIRMHYITAGSGPAIVLLHGTPKNSFYWYKLFPLLTEHFTVVAPDLRGFGFTDKPPATEGYDCQTNADDVGELMTQLGHEKFHVHGEDRGGEYAYAVAATFRDRVLSLSFCEMLLTGFGLEDSAKWTPDNVTAQFRMEGVWCWHLPFFWIPQLPEMLIEGKEREFWSFFMIQECYNPVKIEPRAIDHWIECCKAPGGLRGILETYRSAFKNLEVNKKHVATKLTCPVQTIGAPEFFGPMVRECALQFAENVQKSEIFEECGHSLALEQEERLAQYLKDFMLPIKDLPSR